MAAKVVGPGWRAGETLRQPVVCPHHRASRETGADAPLVKAF